MFTKLAMAVWAAVAAVGLWHSPDSYHQWCGVATSPLT
jgi:hypothetical protein